MVGALSRPLLTTLTPAGQGARLSVLIYHRVLAAEDPLRPDEPTVAQFEEQLRWVADWFNVLPLSEAIEGLRSNRLPARPLAITFDDGYADNFTLALPVLKRLGLPATFFVATGYLDGGRMFNDSVIEAVRQARGPIMDLRALDLGTFTVGCHAERRAAIGQILERLKYLPPGPREGTASALAEAVGAMLPTDLMMTSDQVGAMHAAGMQIGAHTVSHPILAEIELDRAREEIRAGRARLQEITEAQVRVFAYPNGRPQRDYRREHAALVRELGFEAAVSTAWGVARAGADLFQLPRFTPWDRSRLRFGLRLAKNLLGTNYVRA